MEKQIRKIATKIMKEKEVIAVILFGSYAKNKEYANDIDLCIMFDKNYGNITMTKKRLAYSTYTPNKFDIQIFQLLPLYIRKRILKEGKLLYSKDTKKVYDISYLTIKDYGAFERHYKDYIKAVR